MNLTDIRHLAMAVAFLLVVGLDLAAAQNQKQPDQTYVIEGTPDRLALPASLCLEAKPNSKICDVLRPPTGFSQASRGSLSWRNCDCSRFKASQGAYQANGAKPLESSREAASQPTCFAVSESLTGVNGASRWLNGPPRSAGIPRRQGCR